MKFLYLTIIFLSFIFAIDNAYNSINYKSQNLNTDAQYQSINKNHNLEYVIKDQILFKAIDPKTYIVGPGDIFLFNMIISSSIINLDLKVSPDGKVLIPTIGTIDVSKKKLNDAYKTIIDKCNEKYEDAIIYVLIKELRTFKVLITGLNSLSGMHPAFSIDRVSDLIKDKSSKLDQLLMSQVNFSYKNLFLDKDIFLIRDSLTININLFDYYLNGNVENNPELLEGDIINIKNSNKITVLGSVEQPIRIKKNGSITYREVIKQAISSNVLAELSEIKIINYKMLRVYSNNEKYKISNIDTKYVGDFDHSFINSRRKTTEGLMHINNSELLKDFLNSEASEGDIIIIPDKIDYVEIIGGVNKPGTYKYNSSFNFLNYLDNSGGFSEKGKKKDIYLINNISGAKLKINKTYIPNPGDVIFVQESVNIKQWEKTKDIISIIGSIASSLIIINTLIGN